MKLCDTIVPSNNPRKYLQGLSESRIHFIVVNNLICRVEFLVRGMRGCLPSKQLGLSVHSLLADSLCC